MTKDVAYLVPADAGNASTASAVGRKVARLLDALSGDRGRTVSVGVASGGLLDDVDELRLRIVTRLKREGWRVRVGSNDRYQVLPPLSFRDGLLDGL